MTRPQAPLAAYARYRLTHADLFRNPPNAAFEIVFDDTLQQANEAGVMYEDGYYLLLRDAVRFRDGTVGAYTRLVPAGGHGGAAVLPLLGSEIVLVRHFRHATRDWHWEIPRGFAQGGEPPEETARREVTEELGVPASDLVALGSVHPDTGASNVHTRLYLAHLTGIGKTESAEGIDKVCTVALPQFDAMVRDEAITDSFTLAAVLQARARGLLA